MRREIERTYYQIKLSCINVKTQNKENAAIFGEKEKKIFIVKPLDHFKLENQFKSFKPLSMDFVIELNKISQYESQSIV